MRVGTDATMLLFALLLAIAPVGRTHAADAGPGGASAESRNVVLLISDDQGLDAGCYGNRDVYTPNLDSLAAQGARFTNAYAAVSSCSPSRSTLFTGLYNHASGQYGLAHGAHNQRTRADVRSLPALLNAKGYRTGIIGKCHVEPASVYPFHVQTGGKAGRNPEALRRLTREFVHGAAGAPFLLVVGFSDTHRAGGDFPRPPGDSATSATIDPAALRLPDVLTDLPEVRRDYAAYLQSVNNLDRCVGAVLNAVEGSAPTSSTLVVFLSDNGIPFPGAKTNLYDPGIRLPMVVRAPGAAKPGTTCEAMVSWVDIAPTILEWTASGHKEAAAMHGRSILPMLRDPKTPGWDRIFASHTFHEITMYYPMRCVRNRSHKLIWNLAHQLPYAIAGDIGNSPSWKAIAASPGRRVGGRSMEQYLQRPEFELYDMRADARELSNLAGDPAHRQTLEKLKEELIEMMRRTKDPWAAAASRSAQ